MPKFKFVCPYIAISGKSEPGVKAGAKKVLSDEEEDMLVEYIILMADIGYPLTKIQLLDDVEAILQRDGRKTTFKDNGPRPGMN